MGDAVASRERILESWSSRPLSKKITPEDITNRRNILRFDLLAAIGYRF
jgi:hypothetical protein